MNIKKVLASLALASMLVACGTGGTSSSNSKYAKVGYSISTTVNEKGQVNTTTAVVGLDKDGKIAYVDIDVAQQTPSKEGESTKTKKEKKDDYGMKSASGISKEWYEQIDAYEQYITGKTVEEVKAVETYEKDASHPAVPKEGTDLASSVTINIADYQAAVETAVKNAVSVSADSIGIGEVVTVDATKNQVNTTVAAVALDKDGKIVWSAIDVAQTKGEAKADTRTKLEKQDDYGMKSASGIDKEYYEQIAAFVEFINGKTASDIKAIETYEKDASHPAVPKEGTDLASSVTINIADYQEALAEAFTNAK